MRPASDLEASRRNASLTRSSATAGSRVMPSRRPRRPAAWATVERFEESRPDAARPAVVGRLPLRRWSSSGLRRGPARRPVDLDGRAKAAGGHEAAAASSELRVTTTAGRRLGLRAPHGAAAEESTSHDTRRSVVVRQDDLSRHRARHRTRRVRVIHHPRPGQARRRRRRRPRLRAPRRRPARQRPRSHPPGPRPPRARRSTLPGRSSRCS